MVDLIKYNYDNFFFFFLEKKRCKTKKRHACVCVCVVTHIPCVCMWSDTHTQEVFHTNACLTIRKDVVSYHVMIHYT